MEIRPDGIHVLDPCSYDVIETHEGVNLKILRCRRCGNIDFEWTRGSEKEDEDVIIHFCNRCGKELRTEFSTRTIRKTMPHYRKDENVELCVECTAAFDRFMNGESEGANA